MVVRMWRNYGGHGVEPMCSFKEFGAAAHDAAVDVFQFYDGALGINQSLTRAKAARRLGVLAVAARAIADAVDTQMAVEH